MRAEGPCIFIHNLMNKVKRYIDPRVHSHNIPQKFNTDKKQQRPSTELQAVEGPCIIGGEYPDNRFSTQQGKTEQK